MPQHQKPSVNEFTTFSISLPTSPKVWREQKPGPCSLTPWGPPGADSAQYPTSSLHPRSLLPLEHGEQRVQGRGVTANGCSRPRYVSHSPGDGPAASGVQAGPLRKEKEPQIRVPDVRDRVLRCLGTWPGSALRFLCHKTPPEHQSWPQVGSVLWALTNAPLSPQSNALA